MKKLLILALSLRAYGQMGSGGYHPPIGGGVSGGAVGGASNLTLADAVICVSSAGVAKECAGGSTTSTIGGAIAPQANQTSTAMSIQTGGLQVSSASSSFGANAYPYPGRILSIFNNVSAGIGFALGLDVHPNLIATANNDALRGMWVSPDSFSDGGFTGVTHGGIHNANTLEQTGKIVGSQITGDAGVQTAILQVGQDGTSATLWDLKSLAGNRLYGMKFLPSLFNGAAVANTIPAEYGVDMKVNSSSLNTNTVTELTSLHIQSPVKDGNTTIGTTNGIKIEASSAGSTNVGLDNEGTLLQNGASTFGSTLNKVTLTAPATAATLTLANNGSLITAGAFATTLTSSATTNFTLPAGSTTGVAGGNNITTAGAVPYVSASGILTQDQTSNHQFFWDSTNHRLGIGTITPGTGMEIVDSAFTASSGQALAVRDATAQATGVGGGVGFWGNYTDAGSNTIGAAVRTYKINSTTGNFAFGLKFMTRLNGSGGVATGMTLDDASNLVVVGGATSVALTTSGAVTHTNTPGASASDIPLCLSTTFIVHTAAATCGVSARRFKENILPLQHGLDYLMRMRPVTYNVKRQYDAKMPQAIGFIAEDMAAIDPLLGAYEKGKLMNYSDRETIAILVKAVQELKAEVDSLKARR